MRLQKKHHVKNYDYEPASSHSTVSITTGGRLRSDIRPDRIAEVIEEVAHWRKANAIHKWFVDTVQNGVDNCATYYVSSDQLDDLLDLVTLVIDEPRTAPDRLPAYEGFFYGTNDYDESYFSDLEYTRDMLSELLDEHEGRTETDYAYCSSW